MSATRKGFFAVCLGVLLSGSALAHVMKIRPGEYVGMHQGMDGSDQFCSMQIIRAFQGEHTGAYFAVIDGVVTMEVRAGEFDTVFTLKSDGSFTRFSGASRSGGYREELHVHMGSGGLLGDYGNVPNRFYWGANLLAGGPIDCGQMFYIGS